MVGIGHAHARYPHNLSGGEAQRVALARALAVEAPIMLMDEPFAALDPGSRDRLRQLLLDVQKQARRTIIFVTHDIDEALQLADRIVVLSSGPAHVQDIVSPRVDGAGEQLYARLRGAYA